MKYARHRLDDGKLANGVERKIDRLLGSPVKTEFRDPYEKEKAQYAEVAARTTPNMSTQDYNRLLVEIYGKFGERQWDWKPAYTTYKADLP